MSAPEFSIISRTLTPDSQPYASVLKPDGAMHLMVYAPYGRTGIYMLQEFCRRVGIRATNEGIGDLISALRALPPGHPLENLLREAPDFQQGAALADALLHPQDRAYSVPQLLRSHRAGWVDIWPVGKTGALLRAMWCDGASSSSLADGRASPAEQFAAAELFRGTMVRHSVIVYRNDRASSFQPISFAGDAWLKLCADSDVRNDLRSGPAYLRAVLINQNHTYTDLIMAINATEKRMFDAIDGNRSIGDILEMTLPSSRGRGQLGRTHLLRTALVA